MGLGSDSEWQHVSRWQCVAAYDVLWRKAVALAQYHPQSLVGWPAGWQDGGWLDGWRTGWLDGWVARWLGGGWLDGWLAS